MNRNMILRQFLERQIPRQNDAPKQKPNISLKQWLNGSKSTNPRFLKQHILNFFISQGLYDIGVQFSKQAGIAMPDIQQSQVKARYNVKRLIEQGKVDQGLQQLQKLKLKNKKIKLNEEAITKVAKKQQINIQEQGIQLQEIKKKKQNQVKQKLSDNNAKKEIIQQEQPKKIVVEPHKEDKNNGSGQKNSSQQQQPMLQSRLFQSEISPASSDKQLINMVQIQNQPKQQNDDSNLKAKQLMNQRNQKYQQIHHIFEEGKNKELLFTLNCLKVIQLIKQNKIEQSIKTAREILLPFAKKANSTEKNQTLDEEQMQKIEKVMSLIAFSNFEDSPNYNLTTVQFRAKVAHQLNIYLLNESSTEAITALIRLTKWCQKRLKKHVDFPQLNLSSATLYD